MKFGLAIILLITSLFSFGQNIVAETNRNNVLYRHYPNRIAFGSQGISDSLIIYTCPRCLEFYKDTSGYSSPSKSEEYVVIPGEDRIVDIFAYRRCATSQDSLIDKKEFRVRNLPDPTLKIASFWSGDTLSKKVFINLSETPTRHYSDEAKRIHKVRLFAMYPPEMTLNASFRVQKWDIIVGKKRFSCEGSTLTDGFLTYLKNHRIQQLQKFIIEAKVLFPTGERRMILNHFYLRE